MIVVILVIIVMIVKSPAMGRKARQDAVDGNI